MEKLLKVSFKRGHYSFSIIHFGVHVKPSITKFIAYSFIVTFLLLQQQSPRMTERCNTQIGKLPSNITPPLSCLNGRTDNRTVIGKPYNDKCIPFIRAIILDK